MNQNIQKLLVLIALGLVHKTTIGMDSQPDSTPHDNGSWYWEPQRLYTSRQGDLPHDGSSSENSISTTQQSNVDEYKLYDNDDTDEEKASSLEEGTSIAQQMYDDQVLARKIYKATVQANSEREALIAADEEFARELEKEEEGFAARRDEVRKSVAAQRVRLHEERKVAGNNENEGKENAPSLSTGATTALATIGIAAGFKAAQKADEICRQS